MSSEGIQILYAGRKCINADPRQYPQADGKANSFYCPLGPEPGRAWVLMLRRDVDQIKKAAGEIDKSHPLVFVSGNNTTKFPVLFFHRARNVSGGPLGDPNRCSLVELLDKRAVMAKLRFGHGVSTFSGNNRTYNCIFPPGVRRLIDPGPSDEWTDEKRSEILAKFYNGSLNQTDEDRSATEYEEWTWQTMLDDLWLKMKPQSGVTIGEPPKLPYSPSFNPRNWNFFDLHPWKAISIALAAIRCAVCYDPILDKFSYVQLGTSPQPGLAAAEKQHPLWLDDADIVQSNITNFPWAVAVWSRRQYEPFGAEPIWQSDQQSYNQTQRTAGAHLLTNVKGVQVGTVDDVWNDEPQQMQMARGPAFASAHLANKDDLTDYDIEIVANYLKDRQTVPSHRIYQGVCPEFRPGPIVKAVLWRNYGIRGFKDDGFCTEVLKGPGIPGAMPKDARIDLIDVLHEPDEMMGRGRYNMVSAQRYPPQSVLVSTGSTQYVLPETDTYVFSGAITHYTTEDDADGTAEVNVEGGQDNGYGTVPCWIIHAQSIGFFDRVKMRLPILHGKQLYHGLACEMASFGPTDIGDVPVRPVVIIDVPLIFECRLQEDMDLFDNGVGVAAKFLDFGGSERGVDTLIYPGTRHEYPVGSCSDNFGASSPECLIIAAGNRCFVKWERDRWRVLERPYGILQPAADLSPASGGPYPGLAAAIEQLADDRVTAMVPAIVDQAFIEGLGFDFP